MARRRFNWIAAVVLVINMGAEKERRKNHMKKTGALIQQHRSSIWDYFKEIYFAEIDENRWKKNIHQ